MRFGHVQPYLHTGVLARIKFAKRGQALPFALVVRALEALRGDILKRKGWRAAERE